MNDLMRPMNNAPSSVSRFISGDAAARDQRRLVVVPQLGNAIDLDIGLGNVQPRTRADDVRLNIAPHTRHRVRQRPVHLQPVLHELRVRQFGLAREQANDLDHAACSIVDCSHATVVRCMSRTSALSNGLARCIVTRLSHTTRSHCRHTCA